MPDVQLSVGGREYGGWKSVRVTRGIEAISGAFEIGGTSRWDDRAEALPVATESECVLYLEGEPVITGWVDRLTLSLNGLSLAGRDKTGALVDSSAYIGTWEFLGVDLVTLARRLCAPFGIPVTVQPGLTIPKLPAKVSIDPGDSAFDALERACRLCGVLPITYGVGSVMLARAGSEGTATALVEGENILSASAEIDASGRFARYVVVGQHPGSDEAAGDAAAAVRGEARDVTVRRTDRILVVRGEGAMTPAQAKLRAQWDAKVRAARGSTVAVRVQGWTQGDGKLWPINALVPVESPKLRLRGENEMLIAQATYSLDDRGGTVTDLALKRPDAYLPEPVVTAGRWKELDRGAAP